MRDGDAGGRVALWPREWLVMEGRAEAVVLRSSGRYASNQDRTGSSNSSKMYKCGTRVMGGRCAVLASGSRCGSQEQLTGWCSGCGGGAGGYELCCQGSKGSNTHAGVSPFQRAKHTKSTVGRRWIGVGAQRWSGRRLKTRGERVLGRGGGEWWKERMEAE